MNINRHNYEEYFLLYVDGELSTRERAAVNAFVAQNPDLATELDMLGQTVLKPDHIPFHSKDELYKTGRKVNAGNYTDYLLLYLDGELNATDQQEVEDFLAIHAGANAEWNLLQQTRLPYEQVVYANKQALYRYENDERKVVPMRWFRMAAAAAVIAIAGSIYLLDEPKPVDQPLANNNTSVQSPVAPVVAAQAGNAIEKPAAPTILPKVQEEPVKQQYAVLRTPAPKQEQKKTEEPLNPVAPKQKLLPPTPEMIAALIVKEPGARSKPKLNMDAEPTIDASDLVAVHQPATQAESNETVKQAVYTTIEEPGENNTIYFANTALNKNKLKGIFRKATALFDKQDNEQDDNVIHIASFKIKSK